MEPLYGFLNVAETIFKRSDRFLFRKTVFGDEIDLFRRHIFVFQDRDERRNVVFERDASGDDVVVRLPETNKNLTSQRGLLTRHRDARKFGLLLKFDVYMRSQDVP